MAAGLGFKTFTTGEVLTAADTNGYLMQGVLVFASSAARASAITSPQEGQYSYLKDTDALEYYSGSAWVGAPVGDITGVTAGTGISGGGTSGTVTVTNSMATAIDAKGDLVVGTGADAFSRLAVGTNNYILTADSAEATGLKWAAAAGGGTVIKVVYGSTTTSTSISSTSFTDTTLTASITPTANTSKILVLTSLVSTLTKGGTGVDGLGQKARIMRDSTAVFTQPGAYQSGYFNPYTTSTGYEVGWPVVVNYLDSPATTSSTTYKLQIALNSTTFSAASICQHGSGISTMILLEIGA